MENPPPTPLPTLPAVAALLSGAILVLLGQFAYPRLNETQPAVAALIGIGVALFALGAMLARRRRVPRWLARPAHAAARWFDIETGQLVLLAVAPLFGWLARLTAGDGLLAYDAAVASAAWLIGCAAVVLGSWRSDGDWLRRIDKRDFGIVAVLLIGALVARVTALSAIPTTLSGDEASAGLSAVNFVTGRADNWFSIGWFSFPSLFYALQSAPVRWLGQTIVALRLLTALAGALTVVGVYVLARGLFGRTVAFFAAALLLASHFHIHFSRIALQNTWDGLFTVMALAGLWLGWHKGWRLGFIVSGVALGLGQYFYVSFRVVPVLVLAWSLTAALLEWPRFKKRLPDLILAAWIALIVFLPLALYFIDNPLEFNAPLQRVSVFGGWLDARMAATGWTAWRVIAQQVGLTAAGITFEPLQHWYNPGTPLLLPAASALFLLGTVWSVINFNLRYLLVWLPILGVILAGGLSQDAPASQRYIIIATLTPIVIALPLAKITDWIGAAWPRLRWLATAAALLAVAALMFADLSFYFRDVYGQRGYVLGGYNTETAMQLADYLAPFEEPNTIYFFGWPRMNYASIATVPYLVPQHDAIDVMTPLEAAPSWQLGGPTFFLFLPERAADLPFVEAAYPSGSAEMVRDPNSGRVAFIAYHVP